MCIRDRPYTDLKKGAKWWPSEIGTTTAFRERLRRPHHPLVNAPFFTFWCFRLDIMHLWDCKGLWAIMMGSALWLLVHSENRLGPNMAKRLENINEKRQAWYTTHKTKNRMPQIRIHNLVDSEGFANLHSPGIKAANTRSLVPFVADLVMQFCDSGSVYHKAIQKMFKAATDILDCLYKADMFLNVEEQDLLKESILKLGQYFQLAQAMATEVGHFLWHLTPKVHQTMHIIKQARLINPVAVQNYQEESFHGVVTKIWHGHAGGTYLKNVQRTVLFKYLLGFLLNLKISLDIV